MAQSLIWRGTTALVEQSTSPQWNYAEEVTAVSNYKGPAAVCVAALVPKGTSGSGVFAGLLVKSSSVTPERGSLATLQIVMAGVPAGGEGGPAAFSQLPPEEYGIEPIDKEYAIELHPRYASLTDDERTKARAATNAGTKPERDTNFAALSGLALELARKIERGTSHYSYPGLLYTWVLYSLTEPSATIGGAIVSSPSGPVTEPSGFQWLRKCDRLDWTGTYWRLTRQWHGTKGFWDADLYPVP